MQRLRLRSVGAASIVLGLLLLAIGWSIGNDFLGLLFMVFGVMGVILLIADSMRRRSRA
jgi:hypothetical protein